MLLLTSALVFVLRGEVTRLSELIGLVFRNGPGGCGCQSSPVAEIPAKNSATYPPTRQTVIIPLSTDSILAQQTLKRELLVRRMHRVQVFSLRIPGAVK